MTACNIFDPTITTLMTFLTICSVVQVAVSDYMLPGTNTPFKAVFYDGSWEQIRLYVSFLCLRFAAGAPFHSITVSFSEKLALRVQIKEPSHQLKITKVGPNPEEEFRFESMHGMWSLDLKTVLVVAPIIFGVVFLTSSFSTTREI